jgi:thiamine-phosphate pyrophosphorylase
VVTPGGLVVLTDRRSAAGSLVQVVEAAVRGGAEWVILRERDLPYAVRRALADELRAVLPAGRLIVAGPDPLGGDAVHLAAADPLPLDDVALVGRSCRGVPRLSMEDYVTLSPIYPTDTKPGYGPALGPDGASAFAESATLARPHNLAGTGDGVTQPRAGGIPWLALGGIDSAVRAAASAKAGAQGLAVLGAVMRASDPARVAAELAEGFAAGRQEAPVSRKSGTGRPSAAGPWSAAGPLPGAGSVSAAGSGSGR